MNEKMNLNNVSKRLYKWDNLKALLIFLVVVGHLIDRANQKSDLLMKINYWIYMFHMPAFIFVSGLFSKNTIRNKDFRKSFRYLKWFFILKIIFLISTFLSSGSLSFSFLTESGLPWYCFAIFAFQLISMVIDGYDKYWVLGIAVVIGCLAGYDANLGDFLCSSRILTFFPFFYAEYLIDYQKMSNYLNNFKIKLCALFLLSGSFFVVYFKLYGTSLTMGFLIGRNAYANVSELVGLYGGFFRFIYYIAVFLIISSLVALISNKRLFITSFGELSLIIYMLHIPIVRIVNDKLHLDLFIKSFGVPQSITILIVTICIFFLCRMEWVHKPLNKILYFNVPEKTDNSVKGNGYFKSFFYDRTLTILDSKNEE
ncbi:acyltransferase family protein [Enterococcus hirae]